MNTILIKKGKSKFHFFTLYFISADIFTPFLRKHKPLKVKIYGTSLKHWPYKQKIVPLHLKYLQFIWGTSLSSLHQKSLQVFWGTCLFSLKLKSSHGIWVIFIAFFPDLKYLHCIWGTQSFLHLNVWFERLLVTLCRSLVEINWLLSHFHLRQI